MRLGNGFNIQVAKRGGTSATELPKMSRCVTSGPRIEQLVGIYVKQPIETSLHSEGNGVTRVELLTANTR